VSEILFGIGIDIQPLRQAAAITKSIKNIANNAASGGLFNFEVSPLDPYNFAPNKRSCETFPAASYNPRKGLLAYGHEFGRITLAKTHKICQSYGLKFLHFQLSITRPAAATPRAELPRFWVISDYPGLTRTTLFHWMASPYLSFAIGNGWPHISERCDGLNTHFTKTVHRLFNEYILINNIGVKNPGAFIFSGLFDLDRQRLQDAEVVQYDQDDAVYENRQDGLQDRVFPESLFPCDPRGACIHKGDARDIADPVKYEHHRQKAKMRQSVYQTGAYISERYVDEGVIPEGQRRQKPTQKKYGPV
jgi:hypothetical protein